MAKGIVVIGGGPAQLPLVEAALSRGLRTAVVDERRLEASKIANITFSFNRYDFDSIKTIDPRGRFDAVVSGGSDKAVNIMARYAETYGLHSYVSVATSQLPMEKGRTRELLHTAGVPVPRSVELSHGFAGEWEVSGLTAPLVVKPVDGIGQLGVSYIGSIGQMPEAVEQARRISDSGRVLVQEFIEGREIGINGFVFDGKLAVLTIGTRLASRKNDETFGVALQKEYSRGEYDRIQADVVRVLEQACSAIGFRQGPIYAQLIVSRGGVPFVIEIMPRLSGGEDPRLVKLATGFDIAKATIDTAIGVEVVKDHYVSGEHHAAVVIQFLTASPGVLVSVSGVEEARRLPGIEYATAFYGAGHKVGTLKSSRERLGCVIGVGESLPEARANVGNAVAGIRMETR